MEKTALCVYVTGNLYIGGSSVKHFPENLTVSGDLYLKDTAAKLSKGLTVFGNLTIEDSNITELPKGLRVEGDLDIEASGITEIPDDAFIGGDIYGLECNA